MGLSKLKTNSLIIIILISFVLLQIFSLNDHNVNIDDDDDDGHNEHSKFKRKFLPIRNDQNNRSKMMNYSIKIDDNITTLLNLKDFRFLINEPNICKSIDNDDEQNSHLFLAIFIHSATNNFDKRNTIRKTWGNHSFCYGIENLNIRLVFMLGITENETIQNQIEQESQIHGDIIQGSFLDTYRNITYKHLMGLKWINHFCPYASYILKADDDIFVDVHQLIYYLRGKFGDHPQRLMACYVNKQSRVARSYRSKWRVSYKEYSEHYYPAYCDGWTIIMSNDITLDLYRIANNRPLFWIDDVFISGILANDLQIVHYDFSKSINCYRNEKVNNWLTKSSISLPPMLGLVDANRYNDPNYISDTIVSLWNKTVEYYRNNLNIDIENVRK
uniref:Hexosyltransferase n=2 Tax=Dermatophagoides pteronyssinus TaxID=6956 RepID=A0A6P6YF21_DERPT|nr:beta-1,3-galactosyltransferase 5-like [Dermatophagoides pteronyssinus]